MTVSVFEMKNGLNGIHGRLDLAEETIIELRDITIEIVQK
jgi:hypothetical protein